MKTSCVLVLAHVGRTLTSLIFFLWSAHAVAQQVPGETPGGTKYLVYTPPSYSNAGPGSPLLVSLHGGSGIGDDLGLLVTNSHSLPSNLIHTNNWDTSLPFIVVSPQLKRDLSVPNFNDQVWPAMTVDEVVEYITNQYNIDESRIYLTGISLGGAGCWTYASAYPEKVAAIVPFSGVTHLEQACPLKDIPVWVFHGDNDGLVVRSFSTSMVETINLCQPAGLYKPHLTLIPAQAHEGWNPILSGASLYDVYRWMLKFQKGNTANTAPFVTAGGDRKVQLPLAAFHIVGDYFDSDGVIQSVQWTRVSGPNVPTMQGQTTNSLKLTGLIAGTYVFRLSVTDNDGGNTEDTMTLTLVNSEPVPIVTGIRVTDKDLNPIRTLTDDDILNFSEMNIHGIDLFATANSTTKSVRWSINAFNAVFDRGTNASSEARLKTNVQYWIPDDGVYVICATPYSAVNASGTSGICKCVRVTMSRNIYYAKPNSNVSLLASWGDNPDGSGNSPASLTASPATYIVPGVATLNAQTEINANSKLIVAPGGSLTLNARFVNGGTTATFSNINIEGTGTLRTIVGLGALGTLSGESTMIYDGSTNYNISSATYGNLILRGTGTKSLNNLGFVRVRKTMTIEPNTVVQNSGNDSGEFLVLGTFDMQSSTNPTPDRAYPIRFGGENAILKFAPSRVLFKGLTVHGKGTLTVEKPVAGTIELNSVDNANDQGEFVIENDASLILNGHALDIKSNVDINPNNETGTIDPGSQTLKIDVGSADLLYLYPKRGNHKISVLEFNSTGGTGSLIVSDSLKITDHIKLGGGTIQSNGFITLASNSQTHAASIAPVTGSGNITGDVNVERYYEPGKKYKYVSFPVTGMTVKDLQDYIPVTGAFPQSSPGYSTAASLYYYSEAQGGWVAYPTTNNNAPLNIGQGYAVYMRDGSTPEKVIASGPVHVGNFSFTVPPDPSGSANDGWVLLGNPYASAIQWQAAGWTRSGINNTISIRVNDDVTPGGRFLTWDGTVGDAEFGGVIASGQSFWVRAISGSPALTITENAKTILSDGKFFRTGSDEPSVLKVQLQKNEQQDNAYIKFNADGKPGLDNQRDGVKQKNGHFNFSVLTDDGVSVALKNLSDTLCIHQTGMLFEPNGTGTYSITPSGTAFQMTITGLKLIDQYLDSTIAMEADKTYTFAVNAEPASAASDRFGLWIETKSIPDPVLTFSDGVLTSSVEKGNRWFIDGVEIPGATGPQFTPVEEGDYQVVVSKGGCVKTSGKYSFRITSTIPGRDEMTVYPNPAGAELFIRGLPAGTSSYEITTATGVVASRGKVDSTENDVMIETAGLSAGAYIIHIQTGDNVRQFKLFIR